ncbi:hypothetical protein Tco_1355342 [Tanacetum coccineum]
MEDTLTKFMSELAKRHEENSNMIKEIRASTDAAIRNQRASIKTLEIQIGQMRASVSVMPLLTYLNLGLGELAHTKLTVELADRTVKYPKGIAKNVLICIVRIIAVNDVYESQEFLIFERDMMEVLDDDLGDLLTFLVGLHGCVVETGGDCGLGLGVVGLGIFGGYSVWLSTLIVNGTGDTVLVDTGPWKQINIDEYWWRIYKSGDLEVLES